MKKCIDFMATLALILSLTLLVAVLPTEKEGAIYSDTLRLHILARSDSAEDQALKLKIRDKLLSTWGETLGAAGSKAGAVAAVSDVIEEIEADVDAWIAAEGYDYESRVTLGEEWYERREYGNIALPEGRYTSLRIELGEGDGQNWWCVMYPPHCLDVATEDIVGYTKEENALVGGGRYSVKFKILELTSEVFSARTSR